MIEAINLFDHARIRTFQGRRRKARATAPGTSPGGFQRQTPKGGPPPGSTAGTVATND